MKKVLLALVVAVLMLGAGAQKAEADVGFFSGPDWFWIFAGIPGIAYAIACEAGDDGLQEPKPDPGYGVLPPEDPRCPECDVKLAENACALGKDQEQVDNEMVCPNGHGGTPQ